MKPFEFMRVYHPKLGIFVDKHVGSGLIVDNIFKPMKIITSSVTKKFAKESGKKALKSGVSNLSKKTSEKSGNLIMEKLRNMRIGDAGQRVPPIKQPIKQQEESTDMIINRLISGSGVNRRRRVKII